jgi:hypothetical protein
MVTPNITSISTEEWKIVDIFNRYKISSKGRLSKDGKILTPYVGTKGYLAKKLTQNGKGKHEFIHRLVAKAFIPNPENKLYVNHINCDKQCNTVENLEWTSMEENNAHALENGLMIKQKLSAEKAAEIRGLFTLGYPQTELAKMFGCGNSTIGRVVNNKAWKI